MLKSVLLYLCVTYCHNLGPKGFKYFVILNSERKMRVYSSVIPILSNKKSHNDVDGWTGWYWRSFPWWFCNKKLLLIAELLFISSRILYWGKIWGTESSFMAVMLVSVLGLKILSNDSLLNLQHTQLKISTSEKPNRFPERKIIEVLFLKCQDFRT